MGKYQPQTLKNPTQLLSYTELPDTLGNTEDSRYSKLKRWVNQGKLLRIRRGLYYIVNDLADKPHSFEIAQYIYGPSYISFESALSYHKLIPEAVYTTTSACVRRSKMFHTPLGIFSYLHLPPENLYMDVTLAEQNNRRFLVANPWKAICDYVYCYKKEWSDIRPLSQSLRINLDELPPLTEEHEEALNEYYQQKRIQRFLKGITS